MALVDKINAKWGDAPEQHRISQEGNAYLSAEFPGLSYVRSMRLAEPEVEPEAEPEPESEPEPEPEPELETETGD
jgi:hypothetical protein